MKLRTLGKTAVVFALVVASVAGMRAAQRWLGVRARFAEAERALARQDFAGAANRFEAVLDLDPRSTRARVELAGAYAAQYVPGGESPGNLAFASQALDQLRRVVEADPRHAAAIRAIAAIHDRRAEYDEARAWYRRLVALTPSDADAFANLSQTAWREAAEAILDARAGAGFPPDDGRPIPDADLRRTLAARWSREIDDGLANALKAIGLDPQHEGAMAAASSWHRLRADLADTAAQHQQDAAAAAEWMRKALAARRAKAEKGAR